MKHLIFACGLLILLSLSARPTFACFCGELKNPTIVSVAPPPTSDEIRKWRAEQTDYALFTGRVVKIETIHVKRFQLSNDKFPMKKVTVAVQSYWLGVKQAEMVIYTGVGHGDCGVPYRKGNQYLFMASRDPVTQFLETNICGPTDVEDKVLTSFDEIFGRARSFS